MIHFLDTHGILVLVGYYLVICTLGTLPPLPDNATYWQKWGFGVAQAICGNAKNVMQAMGQVATSKTTTATISTTEIKPKE